MSDETVNEYGSLGGYPLGAANDPSAPWNEPSDDSKFELEENNGELCIIKKYGFSGGEDWEDWEEEKGYIDPEDFDIFAAEKLGINVENQWNKDDYLEINDVIDTSTRNGEQTFIFKTSWGEFQTNLVELIRLINIF